jgi:hypothetical protein
MLRSVYSPASRTILCASLISLALLVSPEARSKVDVSQDSSAYQGSYWSVQGHLGVTTGFEDGHVESPGPSLGLSLRLASVLSLADFQLSALGSTYTAALGESPMGVTRISVGVEAHLHPFFLLTLRNSLLWNWIAGIYGSIGADLDLTVIDKLPVETDLGWHVGLGMDIPLTNPNEGTSAWLGVAYRIKFLEVRGPTGVETDFGEHTFLFTIGYRDNDINFMRLPIPTEFNESQSQPGE